MHGVRARFAIGLVWITTASLVAPSAAGGGLEELVARRAPGIVQVVLADPPGGYVPGAVVDPRGVVVFSASHAVKTHVKAGTPGLANLIVSRKNSGRLLAREEVSVLVAGAPTPRTASILLLDPVTDLAFCQLHGVSSTSLAVIRFGPGTPAGLGEELWVVDRVAPRWGSAAVLHPVRVLGRLAVPAPAWIVDGGSAWLGLPAFRANGRAVGVLVRVPGKGGERSLDLLLPAARLRPLVESALQRGAVLREARRRKALEKPAPVPEGKPAPGPTAKPVAKPVAKPAPPIAAPGTVPGARHAGSEGTESAVSVGLRWLARHQAQDGHWSAAGFSAACAKATCAGPDLRARSGRGPGAGDPALDVAVTGLSLLAFLGNGHTHKYSSRPAFKRAVKSGVHYLKRTAPGLGGQLGAAGNPYAVLNHAIGTLALCEAYAVSRDFTLKTPVTRSVAWLLKRQGADGGWGERPGRSDTITAGWAVLALRAAEATRVPISKEALRRARAWFDRVTTTTSRTGERAGEAGLFRAGDGGATLDRRRLAAALGRPEADLPTFAPVPTTTAIATLGRLLAGEARRAPSVVRGLAILDANRPAFGPDPQSASAGSRTDYVYAYFGTYAVFQGTQKLSPPSAWLRWSTAMQKTLLGDGTNRQRYRGEEDGSWDPTGAWGPLFGRVGTTALATMTLEIYYRYERIADEKR